MTKTCTSCKETKDLFQFYKNKSFRDGLSFWCKSCSKKATSKWTKINKDKNRLKATRWRNNNPNREKEVRDLYYSSHKKDIVLKSKQYYVANAEKIKKQRRDYYHKNKNTINQKNKIYTKNRRKTDLNFKLRGNLRVLIKQALKGKIKPVSVLKVVGCSDLAEHIRSTYSFGMTDDNYGNKEGQWSIDHIIPLSSFDLTDPEQFTKANHYTNLKAMWHVDNIRKGNR